MSSLELDYAKCLVFLNSTAEWSLNANDYSSLEWLSEDPKPTEEEIIAAWPAAKAAYEAKMAAREASKQAILDRIGLSAEEVKILLS
jgi:hypothetical protein